MDDIGIHLKPSTVDTEQQDMRTNRAQMEPAKTCVEPFIVEPVVR